jgi:WD40 repeat protein
MKTAQFIAVLFLVVPTVADRMASGAERPEPKPVVGEARLPGCSTSLGPTTFRYGGWVQELHNRGPTVWYSPDGRRVAVTSTCGVYLWDAASGKRLLWVPADEHMVTGLLGFHADGDVIVDCRRRWDDSGAGLFGINPASGKVTVLLQPVEDRSFCAVSPDGKVAFSRTQGNELTAETLANELSTGKELWRRRHPEMSWMRVSSDGSRLVTWSSRADWIADVLDAATGKTVGRFVHSVQDCYPNWTSGGIAVGPNADWLVLAHFWDRGFSIFQRGKQQQTHQEVGPWYDNAFLTRDGMRAVLLRGRCGRPTSCIEVWDPAERKKLSSVATDLDGVMALSPDGRTLAVAGNRTNRAALQFFDVATGKRLPISPEPFDQGEVVWYLPDGTLASADAKLARPVRWNLKTGEATPLPGGTQPPAPIKPGRTFQPPPGTAHVVTSPDQERVIGDRLDPEELDSSPGDSYLGLFDRNGRVVAKYPSTDRLPSGLACQFSPDGKTFVVARRDGTITLFDSGTGKQRRTFRHGGGVTSVAFAPDGKSLATACQDGPILIWSLQDEKKP